MHLTRRQVREIDRLSIEQYHIPGVVLMENAARGAADVACEMLPPTHSASVLILCGGGNNGGDGLAVARLLHNRGHRITVALTVDPARYKNEALVNWQIVSAMNLAVHQATVEIIRDTPADLIIDAIFGTGLAEAPREPFAQIVQAVAATKTPVLAIDLPSGMDCDTGQPLGACIRATQTVTFVAEKAGFAQPAARPFLGKITVADIGCPRELIAQIAGNS